MANDRIVLEWQDAAGGFLRSANGLASGTSPTTFNSAVAFASNAQLIFSTAGTPFISSALPVSDVTWYLTTDTVVYVFQCADGSYIQLTVPAPKQAQFLSGSTIVDPSSGIAAGLISAVIGTLVAPSGSLVTAFVQGQKGNRRVEQNAPGS